ncbi:MAG: MgtC/SapB family protein [Bacteroides sp.]|nr:MgtC/SapB family protein [Bacteroidales bacterium]MBD5295401.1 MgtC/SapB family protein [Bacteroides sp.]MDE6235496.1 MgtC/SapB family protein [Muribaculaceae bacterium]
MIRSVVDQINSLDVNLTNSMFRMLLSMMLGVVIGAERKRKGQIAGIRTFALITMGACLAMLLSIYVPQEYMGLKNGDPGRIAAQVITGIGFLGGGAMIRAKGSVKGLTTAAGIWISAIIGMAVGIGMYVVAVGTTALILMVLVIFDWYEHWQSVGQESRAIIMTIDRVVDDITPYRKVLKDYGVHLSTYFIGYDYSKSRTEINFIVLAHHQIDFLKVLAALREVAPAISITLSSQADI